MPDDVHQVLLDHLRKLVPALFGVPADRLDTADLSAGKIAEWPVSGTPGVGDWYTVVVSLSGDTITIEHWRWTKDINRSDDSQDYGPFELAAPESLDQVEECLRRIAQQPTF